MKTKKFIALIVVAAMLFTFVATIAACHTHAYDEDKWESDANYHWHPATCGHDDEVDKEGHTFNSSNKCTVCGYQKTGTPDGVHQCKDKCPECGKCTSTCTEIACVNKCQGHHECKDICPICKKCATDCDDPVCLAKCPKNHEDALTYTITFDVGEHGTLVNEEDVTMTTVYAYLQRLPEVIPEENYSFVGWFTEVEGGDKVDEEYLFEGEETEITLYAHYQNGFIITLVVGDGELADGESTQYVTGSDGKIVGILPEPTPKAHWTFDNWYDAPTGGKAIVEATTVFTKDTTIYARYIRDNGVWAGETFKAALYRNNGNTNEVEYWLGDGTTIDLNAGDVVSFYINGKLCTGMWITGTGVKTEVDPKPSSVNVIATKSFLIFLKDYSGGAGTDYVVEFRTDTDVEQGGSDLIPAGTGKITIKIGSLDDIVLYLVKSDGTGVKESEFSSYAIYTWDDEIFGNWDSSATKGVVKSTITVAGSRVPLGWIIRWNGIQTGNIENAFKAGGTYLIKLPANNKGDATVTEIK